MLIGRSSVFVLSSSVLLFLLSVRGVLHVHSGWEIRTYFGDLSCGHGSAFFQSIVQYGSCIVKKDRSGKTVGSYVLYLCNAFDGECYSEPTTEPTDEPTEAPTEVQAVAPSLAPTVKPPARRPTPRPTSRPARRLLTSSFINNNTFVFLNLTYPTIDCSGDEASTIATLYNAEPSLFLYGGQCLGSSLEVGGFASGVSYVSSFVVAQSMPFQYNANEATAAMRLLSSPALTLRGFETLYFTDESACDRGKPGAAYQTVYAPERCIRGDGELGGIANSSLRFVNNYNWVTMHAYVDSSDCSGPVSKIRTEANLACVASEQATTIGLAVNQVFVNPLFSTFMTTDPSAELLAIISEYEKLWAAKIAISAVGALCSLLMLLLIIDLKRWTDYNRILFALSLAQLCFDLCLLTSKNRDTLVMEIRTARFDSGGRYDVDNKAYESYILGDLLKNSAVNGVCLISNVLSFTVVYIVSYSRAFPLRRWSLTIATAIILVSVVPNIALYCFRRDLLSRGKTNDPNALMVFQLVQGIKALSIVLNVAAVATVAIFGMNHTRTSAKRSQTADSRKKNSIADELIRRLTPYPLIQAVTQFPAVWDNYMFLPKAAGMSQNGGRDSDDAFYKQPDYRACWALQYTVLPSAGLFFFVALVYHSKDIQRRFFFRLRQFSGTKGTSDATDDAGRSSWLSRKADGSLVAERKKSSVAAGAGSSAAGESASTSPPNTSMGTASPASPASPAAAASNEDPIPPAIPLSTLDEQQLADLIDESNDRSSRKLADHITSTSTILRPLSTLFLGQKGSSVLDPDADSAMDRGSVFDWQSTYNQSQSFRPASSQQTTAVDINPVFRTSLKFAGTMANSDTELQDPSNWVSARWTRPSAESAAAAAGAGASEEQLPRDSIPSGYRGSVEGDQRGSQQNRRLHPSISTASPNSRALYSGSQKIRKQRSDSAGSASSLSPDSPSRL